MAREPEDSGEDVREEGTVRLAIVGSTSLAGSADARRVIQRLLERYQAEHGRDLVIVSGGARGIDEMAAEEARVRHLHVVEHLPTGTGWAFYRARNLRIAQDCDCLVRLVDPASRTYGSGWTRDRARDLGKPTYEYVIELGGGLPQPEAAGQLEEWLGRQLPSRGSR